MRAYGNVASGGPAGGRAPDLTTRPTGRHITTDLERAHAQPFRIPTAPQPAGNRCAACRNTVNETLSTRSWCAWCEEQAAEAIAPTTTTVQATPTPAPRPTPLAAAPATTPAYVALFAQLLADTEGHPDAAIRAARKTVANAATALHKLHAAWTPPTPAPKPRPAPEPSTQRTYSRSTRDLAPAVVDAIVRLYSDQHLTIPAIADRLGISTATVKRYLTKRAVPRRDDRTTHSGSHTKVDDPTLVSQLRALYIDDGLSIALAGQHLGLTQKEAHGVLARNHIPRRPAGSNGATAADHAATHKQRMTALGVTSTQVRTWAHTNGIDCPAVGIVSTALLNAYLNAHHNTQETA